MRQPRSRSPSLSGSTALEGLTVRQQEVLALIAEGLPLKVVAQRLAISDATLDGHRRELLRKFGVDSTRALRVHAALSFNTGEATPRGPTAPLLRHQSHVLPNVRLSDRHIYSQTCRLRFHCDVLRDVADLLRDFGRLPGTAPDDAGSVLAQQTGTLGAKQALLAILARECGRPAIQLVVACHELQLGDSSGQPLMPGRAETLPMAICYLLHEGRRIQIADSSAVSRVNRRAVTELVVDPVDLPRERIRLFGRFAADWCRALDVSPTDFARLRAAQLSRCANTTVFEDLMGHVLPADFEPDLNE